MALHINLYHEIQAQERARRRDPLKLGMIALSVIALGFVGFYLLRLGQATAVFSALAADQAQWEDLKVKEEQAKARATELEGIIAQAKTLTDYMENRFHWAPVLAKVGTIVPPNVQITVFSGDMRSENQAQVTLDGLSAGEEPRNIAENLRTSLGAEVSKRYKGATATFVSLENGITDAVVNGNRWPTANFTIRVELDPTKRINAVAAENGDPGAAEATPNPSVARTEP